MTDTTVHVRITGRVQGVGYRAWVEGAAAELGLSGWVRNRRDGSVEAVFSGRGTQVADMVERCKTGSRAAVVAAVTASERPHGEDVPAGFEFRPTVD